MSKAIGHDPDEEIEASRAPLLDHLIELRMRLIICVVAIALAFGVCFAFVKPIFLFLVRPFTVAEGLKAMQDAGGEHGAFDLLLALVGVKKVATGALANITLQATAPLEQFFTNIKLAAFGGIILAFPVIAWQLYRFVAPGLYKKERNAFLPFLIASPVLFLMGASLVYYVMLPFVLWFSLSQQMVGDGVQVVLQTRVSEYLTLVTTLLLAFGLSFQLPVVLSLGAWRAWSPRRCCARVGAMRSSPCSWSRPSSRRPIRSARSPWRCRFACSTKSRSGAFG